MIFKHRKIGLVMLIALPVCLVISAIGSSQQIPVGPDQFEFAQTVPGTDPDKALKEDGGGESQNTGRPNPADSSALSNLHNESHLKGDSALSEVGLSDLNKLLDRRDYGRDRRLFQYGNVVILWEKEKDQLRGFSVKTGKWNDLKIEKQGSLRPFISTDVAGVRVGDKIAAYSGITGTWDVLSLSDASDARLMAAPTRVLAIDNDHRRYTFEASKGKWASVNDPNSQLADERDMDELENVKSGGGNSADGFSGGEETGDGQNTPRTKPAASNSRSGVGTNSFGGGEYEPGGFGAFSGTNTERLIQGGTIMISWSKDNDELRGFSQKTGEWTNLKIEKQEKLQPTVSNDVAAVRVGDTIAAYSGTTGTWDVLKLSKDSDAEATLYGNYVKTTDNDYLYTFAAAKGKWTSPNDPKFRAPEADDKDAVGNYVTDPGLSPILGFGASTIPGSAPIDDRHNLIRSLGLPLNQAGLAQRIVKVIQNYRGKGLDNDEARKALTEVVENAFDLRQKHQKAEADRLAEKLKKIQEAIEKRETLRDKIIQRRVDELLDPNVEWESSSSLFAPGTTPSYPGPTSR